MLSSKFIKSSFYILLGCTLLSCQTIRELKNFAKCEFRIKEITELRMSGIDLTRISSISEISLIDIGKLGVAFANGSLPLNISFDVEVKNSNDKLAAMEQLDWALAIDRKDYLNGTTNERVEVAPNGGLASFPIKTSLDIRKILDKESLDSILNLIAAFSGKNDEKSRLALKIKPRFRIAGVRMGYPGYIRLGKTFESSQQEN